MDKDKNTEIKNYRQEMLGASTLLFIMLALSLLLINSFAHKIDKIEAKEISKYVTEEIFLGA